MWSLTGIDRPVNTGISHSLFLGHFVGCFLSFHCFYPVLPAPASALPSSSRYSFPETLSKTRLCNEHTRQGTPQPGSCRRQTPPTWLCLDSPYFPLRLVRWQFLYHHAPLYDRAQLVTAMSLSLSAVEKGRPW